MIEIKDIAGLSKPLTRLIEVISQGVGGVSAPYLMKKKADAKAHEIRVISDALKNAAQLHQLLVTYKDGAIEVWQKPEDKTLNLVPMSSQDRAELRLDYQERKRQNNIENISSVAAVELTEDTEIPEEQPDKDWISRFFDFAQDVSSEQMQDLWGRILAGEIRRPGTYSLRTLEFVRNITQSDATIIEQIGQLAVSCKGTTFVSIHHRDWIEKNREIYPGHHFKISELGAMYPTDLSLRIFSEKNIQQEIFISGAFILLVNRGDIQSEIQLPMWKFTAVGSELIELIHIAGDEEYLESLGRYFMERKAVPIIGRILEHESDGKIRYEKMRDISNPPPTPTTEEPDSA